MTVTMDVARPDERSAALQLVLQRATAASTALDVPGAWPAFWDDTASGLLPEVGPHLASRLFVARDRGRMVAATWLQEILPGVWTWWPVRCRPQADSEAQCCLLDGVRGFLTRQAPRFVRSLLEADDRVGRRQMAHLGLQPLTWIDSMVWQTTCEGPVQVPPNLHYRVVTSAQMEAFTRLTSRTYLMTRDCPELQCLLSAEELLQLYRSSPDFSPDNWWMVWDEESCREAGCLILSLNLAEEESEIAYLGLVPEFRGRGAGRATVRQAQWLTVHAGHRRLRLSVDEKNDPAVRCYLQAGFVTYDRQQLFVHLGRP